MKAVSASAAACGLVTALCVIGCSFDKQGLRPITDAASSDVAPLEPPLGGTGGIRGMGGAPGPGQAGGTPGVGGGIGGASGIAGSGGGAGLAGSGGSGGDASPDVPSIDVPADPLGTGALCTTDANCSSGFCVDGVCCEAACTGSCMACAMLKTGQGDGKCRSVTVGSDPDDECALDASNLCGQTGRCGLGACELATEGKTCGQSTCAVTTFTPVPRCNGSGKCVPSTASTCLGNFGCKNGVCNTACATSADCGPGFDCDLSDGKCKVLLASGATCNPTLAGRDCKSGRCTDGVCCDSACAGTCTACSQAKTGVRNGTCAPVKAGIDPDNECAAESPQSCGKTGVCDGQGACGLHPNGTACGSGCCSGGGGDRPCRFVCNAGRCDKERPVVEDSCGLFTCCCPSANGQDPAVCAFPVLCPGGCS